MGRIDAYNVKRGALLDALRLDHPTFVAHRLAFGAYWSVARRDVAKAYREWLGVETHSPADAGNLYALLVYLGAVHDDATERFYGVGLKGEERAERREGNCEERAERREGREGKGEG